MSDVNFLKKGSLVSLRLMTEEDFPLIVRWRNDERVRSNFIYRDDFTLEGQRSWKETMIDTGKALQFIICENCRDLRPVGCVYFRDIDKSSAEAEYGIFIGEEDALGKGYANESADLATDYARDEMGLKRLILRVFADNTSARRSYEHAGFTKVKDLPDVECSDGQKGDMILMEKFLK